jgi:hypothetical protein
VPAETLAPLQELSAAEIRDVVLVAYHKWCITRRYLTDIYFTCDERENDTGGQPGDPPRR